jgi:hypothetical protein
MPPKSTLIHLTPRGGRRGRPAFALEPEVADRAEGALEQMQSEGLEVLELSRGGQAPGG